MDMHGRLTDPQQVRKFALAGDARFTIRSMKTGTRFTFRLSAKADEGSEEIKLWFVSVLTGADNEADFTFLGTIFASDPLSFRHGRKSRITVDAPSAKAFAWFWAQLSAGRLPQVEVWHEGRCGRCGRALTVPESVASGFGPDCIGKM